jgi:hypothetical protein
MQPRRPLRLVAGALVLALPLLGSCGFDKATDRVYTPAAGTNNRDGVVKVLSAVIVSAQPSSGTFLASLSNSSTDTDYQLSSVAGSGDSSDLTVEPSDLSIAIPARGFVNLVNEDPITVSGDVEAGRIVELTLTFDSGDTVTMPVPVVYACNAYEGLDSSASGSASPSASRSASPSESPSPGGVPTDGTSESSSESATTSVSGSSSESSSESPSESSSDGASSGSSDSYDCGAVGVD